MSAQSLIVRVLRSVKTPILVGDKKLQMHRTGSGNAFNHADAANEKARAFAGDWVIQEFHRLADGSSVR